MSIKIELDSGRTALDCGKAPIVVSRRGKTSVGRGRHLNVRTDELQGVPHDDLLHGAPLWPGGDEELGSRPEIWQSGEELAVARDHRFWRPVRLAHLARMQ